MAEMEAAQAETLEDMEEEVKAAMQELTPEARQMALAFVQGLQIGQELANAPKPPLREKAAKGQQATWRSGPPPR